jgi:shikimate kinase
MRNLMEVRGPVYLELADLVVKTDKRSPKRVATDIAESIAQTDAD